jgi:hypothetical protein
MINIFLPLIGASLNEARMVLVPYNQESIDIKKAMFAVDKQGFRL